MSFGTNASALSLLRIAAPTATDSGFMPNMVCAPMVPGFVFLYSTANSGQGEGMLRYDPSIGLQWMPPGAANYGPPVVIAGLADETVVAVAGEDPGAFLVLRVRTGFLPDSITVRKVRCRIAYDGVGNGFTMDDADVGAGNLAIAPVYLYARANLVDVRVWVDDTAWEDYEVGFTVNGVDESAFSESSAFTIPSIAANSAYTYPIIPFVTAQGEGVYPANLVDLRFSYEV